MVRYHKPSSQTGRTFLENHAQQLVSIDFFTVPTIRFQVLYVFLVLAHDRRRILHCHVTAHPTAEWTGQQLREAFPFAQLPRSLLRDREAIFGDDCREQVRDMGIREVLSAPWSPWQRAYVEQVIGSIRRERLDRVPRKLATTKAPFVFRLLSSIENTSFVGEGLTRVTSDSAAGNGGRSWGCRRLVDCTTATNDGLPERVRIHHATLRLSWGL
jgi:transposase InsO family protein